MDFADNVYRTFTKQELERLVAYRAAVAAGFYTDWEETTQSEEVAAAPLSEGESGESSGSGAPVGLAARPH